MKPEERMGNSDASANRESAELRELILGYFSAFTTGDPGWVDRHVSRDPSLRLIGTAPNEWLQGEAGFDVFRREAAGATGALAAEVSEVEAYRCDEIGWGAAEVTFTNRQGATATARFTVVFHREGPDWKVVNSHTSLPVADDKAFDDRAFEL